MGTSSQHGKYRSIGRHMNLCAALAAALFSTDLRCVYGECNASANDPNHARIEKLARSYVYYLDDPHILKGMKDKLALNPNRIQEIDEWLRRDLERELSENDRIRRDPDMNRLAIRRDLIKERQQLVALKKTVREQEHLREMLANDGFRLVDGISNSFTGLQVHLYKDTGKPGKTYIVFRGTEGLGLNQDMIMSNLTGFDPKFEDWTHTSIGGLPYVVAMAKLREWAKIKGVTVAGQSMGAALAQIFIADFPENVKESVLFNSPGIRQEMVDQFKQKVGNGKGPRIWIYNVLGDLVSLGGGSAYLPATIYEMFAKSISGDANVDPTPEEIEFARNLSPLDITDTSPAGSSLFFKLKLLAEPGWAAHREYLLSMWNEVDCDELTNEAYQERRYGDDPYSPAKAARAINDYLEMLTPKQLEEFKQARQADIDTSKWYELLVGDGATEAKNGLYESVMKRIDEILERRREQGDSGGQIVSNPPLPPIHIDRPAAWGVAK